MVKIDKSIDWGSIFSRRGANKEKDSTKVKDAKEIKTVVVTAWYTPQIAVSAGPAEYWGLPGLILELNAGRTTMLCTELVINPEEPVKIVKPSKGKKVTREAYTEIVKLKSEELRARFKSRRSGGRRF
jgi:GLPGLI family protein